MSQEFAREDEREDQERKEATLELLGRGQPGPIAHVDSTPPGPDGLIGFEPTDTATAGTVEDVVERWLTDPIVPWRAAAAPTRGLRSQGQARSLARSDGPGAPNC